MEDNVARSNIDIANQALNMLGHESITAFSEDTNTASLVDQLFETARDTVLVGHPWNCLIARALLAQNGTGPTFGYTYAYTIPTDCLRVLYCDCVEDGYLWEIEGRTVVTNADTPLYIKYIKKDTNVDNWAIYIYNLVILKLAAKLALALTEDGAKANSLEEKYMMKEREARFMDSAEGSAKVIDTDIFIQNRRGVYNPLAVS
jgi:hypothetical protein